MAHKRPATPWPNAGYYFLRLLQAATSAGVLGIMVYFTIRLIKDHFPVPKEFIILIAVPIASLVNVVVATLFKCCGALSPGVAVFVDFLTLAAWGVGFGLLTRAMGVATITTSCNSGTWGPKGAGGVWICNLYKGTWGLCIAAIAAFLGAVIMDLVVLKKKSNKYVPANPRSMQQQKGKHMPDYNQETSYGAGGLGHTGSHDH